MTRCQGLAAALTSALLVTTNNFAAASNSACPLPGGSTLFSVMSHETATILASSVSRGLAIGGNLAQTLGAPTTAIDGPVYLGGAWSGDFQFNAGVFPGTPVWQALFPWELFEDIASRAVPGTFNQGGILYKIIVVTAGGTYNSDDFGVSGQDGSRTLVIFNTTADVALAPTSSGGPFCASVLAPFSAVVPLGTAGAVNGLIVAKSYGYSPSIRQGGVPPGEELVLAGAAYAGPVFCLDPTTTTAPTEPTTVTDTVAVTSTSTPAARVEETTTTIPTAAAVSGKGGKGGATTTIKATTEEEPVTSVDITTDYVDGEDRQGSGSGSGEDKIDPATSDSPKGKKAESKSKSKGKGKDGGKKKGKVTAANAQTEHHGSIAAIAFSVMGVGCLAIAVAVRKLRQRAAYDANLSDDEYATPMTPGRAEKSALVDDEEHEYGTFGGWLNEYAIPTPSQLVFSAVGGRHEW